MRSRSCRPSVCILPTSQEPGAECAVCLGPQSEMWVDRAPAPKHEDTYLKKSSSAHLTGFLDIISRTRCVSGENLWEKAADEAVQTERLFCVYMQLPKAVPVPFRG